MIDLKKIIGVQVKEIITLRGLSLKGKNKIRELGCEWEVWDHKEKVGFSSELNWMLISPTSKNKNGELHNAVRWILVSNDKDFEIVK